MRNLLLTIALCLPAMAIAQNTITSDLVEGGKTLVELLKVIRMPRNIPTDVTTPATIITDSCRTKKLADICFKNRSNQVIRVSLFLRNGNDYAAKPLSLTISSLTQESLYELRCGIYKYNITTGDDEEAVILHEGELRLEPCDKLIREIK